MPNTDLFVPDVVFVSAQRLRQTVRDFAELVPDLVMEIKSKTDCILHLLQEKIQLFLTLEALSEDVLKIIVDVLTHSKRG